MRQAIAIAAAAVAVVLLAACGPRRDYADRAEVLKVQREEGFVRLGTFGDAKGALNLVEEITNYDAIDFTLANGTKHRYPGYTGYMLKVLRLKNAQGDETLLVFRSAEKG